MLLVIQLGDGLCDVIVLLLRNVVMLLLVIILLSCRGT